MCGCRRWTGWRRRGDSRAKGRTRPRADCSSDRAGVHRTGRRVPGRPEWTVIWPSRLKSTGCWRQWRARLKPARRPAWHPIRPAHRTSALPRCLPIGLRRRLQGPRRWVCAAASGQVRRRACQRIAPRSRGAHPVSVGPRTADPRTADPRPRGVRGTAVHLTPEAVASICARSLNSAALC